MHIRGAKIVAAVTEQIDEKSILCKMKDLLPNIAIPYRFVIISEMPKLGSGKIDFKTITERVRDIVQGRNS